MKETMKLIYLASPYSHKDRQIEKFRYKEITRIAAKLHKKYPYAFILPITQSHELKNWEPSLGGSFVKWRDRDLHFISKSDEVWVVLMEGWLESIGVQAEIEFAKECNIPVKHINPETLRFKKTTIKKVLNEKLTKVNDSTSINDRFGTSYKRG